MAPTPDPSPPVGFASRVEGRSTLAAPLVVTTV